MCLGSGRWLMFKSRSEQNKTHTDPCNSRGRTLRVARNCDFGVEYLECSIRYISYFASNYLDVEVHSKCSLIQKSIYNMLRTFACRTAHFIILCAICKPEQSINEKESLCVDA